MTEFRMFDRPGADVAEITTTGGVFKPFVSAIQAVDDEAKVRITDDGLAATIVDPACVLMGDITLPASEFEAYDVQEDTVIGVNVDQLKSLVRRARKGKSDELTLSIRERELSATVSRGYENHDVVSQGSMQLIDPDSIRQEPDIPDLDLSVSATVDARPFKDALGYAVGESEHVRLSVKGVNQHANAMYMGGRTDTREESVAIDNIDCDDTAEALYSADYMTAILKTAASVGADTVTVKFDDEYPVFVDMDGEGTPVSVTYILSPRVES